MAGNVARRPDGRYRARYRDVRGKEHSRHFKRKADAVRWLAAAETARGRGEWVDPSLGKVRIGEWAPVWLATQVQLKASTRARYELALRRHILPTWERVQLSAVAFGDVGTWVQGLTAVGLAPATVRYAYRVFSLMLAHAVHDGRLPRNPAAGVRLPRLVRHEPVFLDHGQVAKLAQAVGEYGLFVRFLAYTGLRWGEATALRVHRLDLERRRVHVVAAVSSVGGKLVEGAPKSHRHRSVPLPRFLAAELVPHVEGLKPDGLVFTAAAGGPLRSANFRQRVWLPAVKSLGLPALRVHDLRHTAASLAVGSGANVKAVQQMLGHASAAMTLDVYAGLFSDDLDSVADRLDEAVRGADADFLRTSGRSEAPEVTESDASSGTDEDEDGPDGTAALAS